MWRTIIAGLLGIVSVSRAQSITFNTNFESGSLGKIEKLDEQTFRCHVAGQCDERGRDRQTSWYFFRLDHVKGRDVTITMTDFIGEYDDKPGAVPMNAGIHPCFSDDGHAFRPIESMEWDDKNKQATLHLHCDADTVWIAHCRPYPLSDIRRLVDELNARPCVLVESIGKSVNGRDLVLLTITNPAVAEKDKKVVWLISREHAWESGTSETMEGALRFITSDDPHAAALRDRFIFKSFPTLDPDGCATGGVRFNANGYDVNRHWDAVNLHSKEDLRLMPEIWYAKRAIFAWIESGRPIDLMINLHNNENNEYIETSATDASSRSRVGKLFDLLSARSSFDPSKTMIVAAAPVTTTNSLYMQKKIPVVLLEQRIATGKKLGRAPTADDRRAFGATLVECAAEAVE